MRAGLNWVAPVLVMLLAGLILVWLVRRAEPRLAFFPLSGEDITPQSYGIAYEPFIVPTDDGERLQVWHLPRADAQAEVVYFHGNGGNLSIWCEALVGLWQQNFDVWALDYRGYGLSTGSPSEKGLYRDVEAVLGLVHEHPRSADVPLLYWGRSLGTSLAAYAASRRPPTGVVLEAGFPSMRAVLEDNPLLWTLSWVASYRFPTAEWMAHVPQPTLVLHGDRDSIIPYHLGQRLYESLPGPKTFVAIPGGDHNDPVPRDAGRYWNAIAAFVTSLRGGSS